MSQKKERGEREREKNAIYSGHLRLCLHPKGQNSEMGHFKANFLILVRNFQIHYKLIYFLYFYLREQVNKHRCVCICVFVYPSVLKVSTKPLLRQGLI
jgi:hypothetical protein